MDVVQPEENIREISLKSGNKIRLTRKDPFGLWYFSFERGPIPAKLEGAFTKVDYALRYLQNLAANGEFDVGEPEPKAPPVETKKVSAKAATKAEELKELDGAKREAAAS